MPKYLKDMYDMFIKMFPNFEVKNVKEHKNGIGIVLTLMNGQKLIFSYKDKRTWWLRTI